MEEARRGLVRQVIDDMGERGAEWSQAWVNGSPHNPLSGTVYRGRNALYLSYYIRRDDLGDPRFMTFVQAKEAGYHVRRGSHSYPIERWKTIAFDRADPKAKVRQPKTKEEWEAVERDPKMGIKNVPVGHYNVFSARDVEGIGPWEPEHAPIREHELVDFLERHSPVPVSEVIGDRAFYVPSQDRIEIPDRRQFESAQGLARVLLHEQGHATGHPSRLNRDQSGKMFDPDPEVVRAYAREELVAELNSLFCANALGVSMPEVGHDDEFAKSDYWQNHVAYLKSWSSGLEDPEGELLRAASAAGNACDWLMRECFEPGLEVERAREAPAVALGLDLGKGAEKGVLEGKDVVAADVTPAAGTGEVAVEPYGAADAFSYAALPDGTVAQRSSSGHETSLDKVLSVPAWDGGAVTWYMGDDAVVMLHERADGSMALVSDLEGFADNSFTETLEQIARGEETAGYMAPFVADEVTDLRDELGIPDEVEVADDVPGTPGPEAEVEKADH